MCSLIFENSIEAFRFVIAVSIETSILCNGFVLN